MATKVSHKTFLGTVRPKAIVFLPPALDKGFSFPQRIQQLPIEERSFRQPANLICAKAVKIHDVLAAKKGIKRLTTA